MEVQESKICTVCAIEKPLSAFVGKRAAQPCGLCRNEAQRQWRADHPDQVHAYQRANNLMRKFGISVEQYDEIHRRQGGCCAVCGKEETLVRNGLLMPLAVDHDHDTGRVRGLLCDRCNKGLGCLGDSVEGLLAAVDYLERSSAL